MHSVSEFFGVARQRAVLASHERWHGYTADALADYDSLYSTKLPKVMQETFSIVVPTETEKFVLTHGNIAILRPSVPLPEEAARGSKTASARADISLRLSPMEARIRKLPYVGWAVADVEQRVYDRVKQPDGSYVDVLKSLPLSFREVPLFALPIMKRSKLCHLHDDPTFGGEDPYDRGGTFDHRGQNKVFRLQKERRHNVPILEFDKDGRLVTETRSLRWDQKLRFSSTLRVRMVPVSPTSDQMMVTAVIPFLEESGPLPIVAVFRLLGFHTRKEILRLIWPPKRRGGPPSAPTAEAIRFLDPSFAHPFMTSPMQDIYDAAAVDAIKTFQERIKRGRVITPDDRRAQTIQQVNGEVVPHVGYISESGDNADVIRFIKAAFLGMEVRDQVHKKLELEGMPPIDFEGYKYIEQASTIIVRPLKQRYGNLLKTMRRKIYLRVKNRNPTDPVPDFSHIYLHTDTMTHGLMSMMSNGVTTVQATRGGSGNPPKIQNVQVNNMLGHMTEMDRVSVPQNRAGKYPELRQVSDEQMFAFCPAQTPEGDNVGLLSNLAVMAQIRQPTATNPVTSAVLALGVTTADILAKPHLPHSIPPQVASLPDEVLRSPSFVRPLRCIDDLAWHDEALVAALGGSKAGKDDSSNSSTVEDDALDPTAPCPTMVYVNMVPTAATDFPFEFAQACRAARRRQVLPYNTGVVVNEWGILVFTDGGVVTFPLLYLPNLHRMHEAERLAKLDTSMELFEHMLRLEIVEYMEPWELASDNLRVALRPQAVDNWLQRVADGTDKLPDGSTETPFTHLVCHPQELLGVAAGTAAYPHKAPTTRACYAAGMSQQAVSTPAMNIFSRPDIPLARVNLYGQKPVAVTDVEEVKKLHDWPAGTNMIMMVRAGPNDAGNSGENEEDSAILSRAAVERGQHLIAVQKSFTAHVRCKGTDVERFDHPLLDVIEDGQVLKCQDIHGHSNYDTIDMDGLPDVGMRLRDGDVIIGRTMRVKASGLEGEDTIKRYDTSLIMQCHSSEVHEVKEVVVTSNRDGHPMIKVVTICSRAPEPGDKLCLVSSHDVLSKQRGFISIADVTLDDEIAVLNPETGCMEYQAPTELISYDYSGPMYNLETAAASLMCTPDHRLWVKPPTSSAGYSHMPASEAFGKGMGHQSSGAPIMQRNAVVPDIPGLLLTTDLTQHWLTLFGLLLSTVDHQWHPSDVDIDDYAVVELNTTDPAVSLMLVPAMGALGLRCVHGVKLTPPQRRRTFTKVIIPADLHRYMCGLSSEDGERCLPDWCFELSAPQCQQVLLAMCKGSGRCSNSLPASYGTKSAALKDDVQVLCQHAGWTSVAVLVHDTTDDCPLWQICIQAAPSPASRRRPPTSSPYTPGLEQLEQWVHVNGRVYCLSVPTQIFLTRRNGRLHFTGNCTRHGQKFTIGCLTAPENLPFVMDGPDAGMVPDIMLGPACINSRNTANILQEGLESNLGLVAGKFVDATPYRPRDCRELLEELVRSGRAVKVRMADGVSGKPLEDDCFIFSCWVQRLVHEAKEKESVRQRGLRCALTRQPNEGRRMHGGMRMGNMEIEALIAAGVSFILVDRTCEASDGHKMNICARCGQLGAQQFDSLSALVQQLRDNGGSLEGVQVGVAPCRLCGSSLYMLRDQPGLWCSGPLVGAEFASLNMQMVYDYGEDTSMWKDDGRGFGDEVEEVDASAGGDDAAGISRGMDAFGGDGDAYREGQDGELDTGDEELEREMRAVAEELGMLDILGLEEGGLDQVMAVDADSDL